MTSAINYREATQTQDARFAERPAQEMGKKMDKAQEIFDQYVAPGGDKLNPDVDLAEAQKAVGELSKIHFELFTEEMSPKDLSAIHEVEVLELRLEKLVDEALESSPLPDSNQSNYKEQGVGLNDIVNGNAARDTRTR